MTDSASNQKSHETDQLTEAQSCATAQAWVKPTLERLSLKQALQGAPTASSDTFTNES